ncbi:hypothetical protein J1N35_017819 [Gossypium stocksii]|uniref:Uncharacterized protein n=1 Tax=Gossypium stocksii TaxID=47602 RepID=A0A9D4A4F1_9ROSI|nr:hypothetical protein J1N35_017819 [Gossypium stocksii]
METSQETADTFNPFSYSKAGIIVSTEGLSGREWLFRWSKGDAPFGLTAITVIKQPINYCNRCHVNSSLTSTSVETSALPLRVLLCPI